MIYLVKLLGAGVAGGACFWAGADLYKAIKSYVAGPDRAGAPRRELEAAVTEAAASAKSSSTGRTDTS